MNFKPFGFPKEFTLKELLRRLLILYDKEKLAIIGQSRSADVGESIEYYLGLDKNTSKKSDWGDYGIKIISGKKITLLGFSLVELRRYEEAIQKYQQVNEIEPEDATNLFNWGRALFQLWRPEEAIQKFQQAAIAARADGEIDIAEMLEKWDKDHYWFQEE